MLPPIAPFNNPKTVLRERMKGERRAAARKRPDAAEHAASAFMRAIDRREDTIVSLYYPIKGELDTEPLVSALIEEGTRVVMPVVTKKKAPLIFRAYMPGEDLVTGPYGELTPAAGAPEATPDILVMPLLAFTREGGRLGYGGGYYDRTLEALRKQGNPLAVGYAYGEQEVDAIPLSPLDQALDWIVTERGAIRC
ncbi:5-formyltetrahydrofolate cyclo-ligase [Hyphococcus lacteus]|uniref:5-formyltetrahydrofolate cyclo-ligase n=1 Tax=Hyphococcus lacteus TaxID=3143536 RepID=A0ABV3Z1A4_9PROT